MNPATRESNEPERRWSAAFTPLTNWVFVTSGNFNNSGNFNVPLPVSPGVPQSFYLSSVP